MLKKLGVNFTDVHVGKIFWDIFDLSLIIPTYSCFEFPIIESV